jgi:hypothetical protein
VRGFQLEEFKGGPNFLSRKLGGFFGGTTNGNTLGEAKIFASLS